YDQLFLLNRDFQFTIYRACRREYLLKLLRDLWEQSSRYRNLATHRALEATSRAEEARAERECILRACERGDSAELRQAVRHNVEQSLRSIQKIAVVLSGSRDGDGTTLQEVAQVGRLEGGGVMEGRPAVRGARSREGFAPQLGAFGREARNAGELAEGVAGRNDAPDP